MHGFMWRDDGLFNYAYQSLKKSIITLNLVLAILVPVGMHGLV